MFNLIQLQDRLRGFSEDQLKQFLRTPDPNIPDFMIMAALDEKNDAKMQEAQMKAQQPSVREEMLAVAGLPAMEAGQMASSMAPKSDVRTNTGGDDMMTMARLAEDMPMEDDMEEDEELDIVETPIRRMSGGGLAGTNETTEMPGLTPENELKSLYNRMQQRYLPQRSSGLQGLGMDIRRQVAGRTDGEVNEFITDVEDMAEERFDVDLGQSAMPTPFGGKGGGHGDPRIARIAVPRHTPRFLNPSMFGNVMRRMNEGGQVKGAFFGGLQQFLNPDGTVKKEFEEAVKEAMKDDDASLTGGSPYEMDENRTQIFSKPEKDDDETPPPGTDDPAPRGFLSDLTASLDKMRADQKEQMDKSQALGLMLEGIKLARRGVIDDESGKGLMFGQQQKQKIQDRLAQLQGLEAKIGIAGANIAQRDRAAQAAVKKAIEKGSKMTTSQLADKIKGYSTSIGNLRKNLSDTELSFDDDLREKTLKDIEELEALRSIYMADLEGRYGGDILDNDFLKALLNENPEDK